tara:strand:+ start:69 stop:416 length:348 start_codon:yes stop_codon:yes gene_type:complete
MSNNIISILNPVNRQITVIPHYEKNETQSGVLLPEDFEPEQSRYITATVLAVAPDCSDNLRKVLFKSREISNQNTTIVVDAKMVEEINLNNKKHYTILENYVVGVLTPPGFPQES